MIWSFVDNFISAALVPVVTMCVNSFSLIFNIITLDSTNTAINYVIKKITTDIVKINSKEIIKKPLYKSSFLDRYIIYVMEYIIYKLLCYLFWSNDIPILYYLLLFSSLPICIQHIKKNSLIKLILKQKEYVIKLIIAKQTSSSIKYFVKIYLHRDIKVKTSDIMPSLDNYQKTIDNTINYIKTLATFLLFLLLKRYSTGYYGISKRIYKYKTGDLMTSFVDDVESAKKFINDIIEEKKWDLFNSQCAQNAMYQIYINSEPDKNILIEIRNKICGLFVKLSSIYNIALFCNSPQIIPILEIIFISTELYDMSNNEQLNRIILKHVMQNFSLVILGSIYAYNTGSIMITCIIVQLAKYVLFNGLMYGLLKTLLKKIKGKIIQINNKSSILIRPILINLIYIKVCALYCPNNYSIWFMGIIYHTLVNMSMMHLCLFFIVYLQCMISNHDIVHILYVSVLLYVLYSFELLILLKQNKIFLKVQIKIKRYFSDYDSKYVHYKTLSDRDKINNNIFNLNETELIEEITKEPESTRVQIVDDYYKD